MKRNNSHAKKVIFTLVIAFAIVSFWRGTWGLMDLYLFPENRILSYVVSILAGILILDLTKNMIKKLV
jgi:uncharacterized membrane protein YjjP (DUF1212 family)